ncbi:5-methylcytosine restriction system specificity protein McrC [Microbacterium sp. NPDC055683]
MTQGRRAVTAHPPRRPAGCVRRRRHQSRRAHRRRRAVGAVRRARIARATDLPVRLDTSAHLAQSAVDPTRTIGRLYPDVVVGETSTAAVLDAKYKRLGGRRGVDREDLYQLHAYASTLETPVAALAYPLAAGRPSPTPNVTAHGTLSAVCFGCSHSRRRTTHA